MAKTVRIDVSGFGSPDSVVRTRYTRAQARAIMRQAVDAINGRAPDTHGFREVFFGAIAQVLFARIYEAFQAKSAHGTDELGNRWVDLRPKTKAYGRMDAREGIPLPGPKYRPTLNRRLNKVWKRIYSRVLRKLGEDHNDIAAGAAWNRVKGMGAITLIGERRDVPIPILQKTGRLAASLEPSALDGDGSYHPVNFDQIVRVQQHELILGTRVPYAEAVDKSRKIWPPSLAAWMDDAVDAGRAALQRRLVEVLRRA